jgi:ATP-dependent exoDNAse (exonuclease V) alpha subunit
MIPGYKDRVHRDRPVQRLQGSVERVTFHAAVPDHTAVLLVGDVDQPPSVAMQHYMLLERNLLYTAVTRGKKLVVIIGQMKALAMAVKRIGSMKRLTNLQCRLHTLMEDNLNVV